MAQNDNEMVTGWVGWIGFACFMLLFAGFFHILEGVAALARNTVYVHGGGYVWVLDYTKWGWMNIIGGVLVIVAALSLGKGNMFGRIFSSVIVVLSALASVAMMPMYPVWSIVLLVADVLILYAIMVHGKEVKKLNR